MTRGHKAHIPDEDGGIAEALIDAIDGDGMLTVGVEELTEGFAPELAVVYGPFSVQDGAEYGQIETHTPHWLHMRWSTSATVPLV